MRTLAIIILAFSRFSLASGGFNQSFDKLVSLEVEPKDAPSTFELPVEPVSNALVTEVKGVLATTSTSNRQLETNGFLLEIQGVTPSEKDQHIPKAAIISRRLIRTTMILQSALDLYTADLRYPADKGVSIHGVPVNRHHWEWQHSEFVEVASKKLGPMKPGEKYQIKKCRDSFMSPWKCNTLAYDLNKLDESTYLLVGRQTKTLDEPFTYRKELCPTGSCIGSFSKLQHQNSAAGTLSFTVFRDLASPSGVHYTEIYEVSAGQVADPAEVNRLSIAQDSIRKMLESEYRILTHKIPSNFCEPSYPVAGQNRIHKARKNHLSLGLACWPLFLGLLFFSKYFYSLKQENF